MQERAHPVEGNTGQEVEHMRESQRVTMDIQRAEW